MQIRLVKNFSKLSLIGILILLFSQTLLAQNVCLTQESIEQMKQNLTSFSTTKIDEKLRKEILGLRKNIVNKYQHNSQENERIMLLNLRTSENSSRLQTLTQTFEKERQASEQKVCQLLRENGWLTNSLVGEDGTAALFYLLKNVVSSELQLQLLPVIEFAAKKNETPKNIDYAAFIDRLRLNLGLNQLFGTQVTEENGFLILLPIQSMEKLDDWRKEYKMTSLKDYLKFLEMNYRMPVKVAHPRTPVSLTNTAIKKNLSKETVPSSTEDEEEVIKVGTNLVNLNLRVLSKDFKSSAGDLEKKDFKIFENGKEEKVEFLSKTETPFDLVLLIDLSGSTVNKQGLIRETTRHFIEGLRPIDRVSIVTFSDKINIISPLSSGKSTLLKSVNKIDGSGGSNIWDALESTLSKVFLETTSERRRAIILMSDGFDDALQSIYGAGSKTSFGHLLESVRKTDISIIPIYLDTEYKDHCGSGGISGIPCNRYRLFYERARNTLDVLAEESGGLMYKANRIEDLEGVYTEVLKDLRTIYSLGYSPTNENSDGTWRSIKVEISNRPNLVVRTKSGYYAQ